jgi:membrane protease YdiL (CAAX protease family)
VRPRLLVGLAVVVGWAALIAVDDVLPGGGDGDIADPTLAFLRTHVLSLSIVAVLLVAFVRWAGWSRDVWRERPERRVPRWWLAFPVLYAVQVAGGLTTADWSQAPSYLLVLLIGTLLVGFTEELGIRGILLTGARGSMPELGVLVVTCVVFGLLHTLNLLHGAPLGPTAVQVAGAAGYGVLFYAIRRATGVLWPVMLLHGLDDFGGYAQPAATPDTPVWAAVALLISAALAVAVVVSVARESRRRPAAAADGLEPAGVRP